VVCEYLFQDFHPRAGDEYLNWYARHLDQALRQGWKLTDAVRRSGEEGVWTICLLKETEAADS
jgi:hypothetical protein